MAIDVVTESEAAERAATGLLGDYVGGARLVSTSAPGSEARCEDGRPACRAVTIRWKSARSSARACLGAFRPRLRCLDHMVVLNETHLWRLLRDYHFYYHSARTYLSLRRTPRSQDGWSASTKARSSRRPWPAASIIATVGERRKLLSAGCSALHRRRRAVRAPRCAEPPRWFHAEPRWSTVSVVTGGPRPRAAAGPKVPGSTK